jgi:pimeloyl-ACP methyl ester carboxylesterase
MTVGGIEIEMLRGGSGKPALLLHGFQTISPKAPFLFELARHCSYFAPSLPGFGASQRPKDFDTIYDLVHHTLDLIDIVPGGKITLIGFSFGGWLAAEAAVMRPADIFNVHPDTVRDKTFHDPKRFAPDFDALEDAELVSYARNRDSLCLYTWNPLLYNPQLKGWLRRINVPTLVLWGAFDGIVSPDYGRAYAGLIPGARFELIDNAGHQPEIEQAAHFVARVAGFMSGP